MRPIRATEVFVMVIALTGGLARVTSAQSTTLRVIGSDNAPVSYAMVTVHGGAPNITSEKGEFVLGSG